VQLPVSAPELELERGEVPPPIGGGAPPRPDGPPYTPLLGEPPALSVEALP
jgi:hypothetical protein